MEPLTQKIFTAALVTVIKGVAITGLMANVVMFYTNKNAGKVSSIVRKKINSIKVNSLSQLIRG